MAYYNNLENEDENTSGMNKPVEPQNGQTAPVAISSGIQTGTLTSAAPAPVAKTKTPSSGSAPGFQAYSQANLGIAQKRLENAAAKRVSEQGQQAESAIGRATTSFGKQMEQGSLANRGQAVQDVAGITSAARAVTAAPREQQASPSLADRLGQENINRFQEVIQARYKGPESLRQAGLYQQASGKVEEAATGARQAQTAGGREEMLKRAYSQRGDYTQGLGKLDAALLNASQQGVKNVQAAASAQGNIAQKLDKEQVASAAQSQSRAREIAGIQEQARKAFSTGKSAEQSATEARLDAMLVTPVTDSAGNTILKADGKPMTQWDQLPESFKDIIRNKSTSNKAMLDAETARIKGDTYAGIVSQAAAAKKAMEKAELADKMSALYGANLSLDGASQYQAPQYTPEEIAAYQAKMKKQYQDAQAAYQGLSGQQAVFDKQIQEATNLYNPNAVVFNPFEAETLGIQAGEGLYNLGPEAIKQGVAERARLVSRDEQLRQAVLSQLAGLDTQNRLDTGLLYADAEKAGTQSILDSLNLAETRKGLEQAREGFESLAQGTDITGEGKKKVSRGNMFGKTTRTYNAKVGGNVGDFLEQAGYDFDAAPYTGTTEGGENLLRAALQASRRSDNSKAVDREAANAQLAATAKGAATGATIGGSIGGPAGAAIGGSIGTAIGGYVGSGTIDPIQQYTNLFQGYAPVVGQTVADIRNIAGGLTKGLGKDISGAVSGIDTGAMKAYGSAIAKQKAVEDLKSKYSQFLKAQGFENRAGIAQNEEVNKRAVALAQLLANLDKTNV